MFQVLIVEVFVGGDDVFGEVGIDECGIDEFLVQWIDVCVGEVVYIVQLFGFVIECYVLVMVVEEVED